LVTFLIDDTTKIICRTPRRRFPPGDAEEVESGLVVTLGVIDDHTNHSVSIISLTHASFDLSRFLVAVTVGFSLLSH